MEPNVEQHLCHAVGCNVRVMPSRLMCPQHWFMLPADVRKRVWQTYIPGQEITKNPTEAYLTVARTAINYVAALEGKPELPSTDNLIKTIERMLKQGE